MSFQIFFASFLSTFYAQNLTKVRAFLKSWTFFQKWSHKSEIRNGEASRLCMNLLWRQWWLQKSHFEPVSAIFRSPWKGKFFKPSKAPVSKNGFWRSKTRFSKSCLKCIYGVKITSWSLFKCRRLVWNRFQTHRMNLEPFYEK